MSGRNAAKSFRKIRQQQQTVVLICIPRYEPEAVLILLDGQQVTAKALPRDLHVEQASACSDLQ